MKSFFTSAMLVFMCALPVFNTGYIYADSDHFIWDVPHERGGSDDLDFIKSRLYPGSQFAPTPTPLPTPVVTRDDYADTLQPIVAKGLSLFVDQSKQMLFVFDDGVQIRGIPISTGLRMSYSPPFSGYIGRYVKTIWGFGSYMDHAWYITKATGNIYLHGAPYTVINGQRHYEGLEYLGVKPSSHGCIRMHPDDAEWLAKIKIEGLPIYITPPDFVKYPD